MFNTTIAAIQIGTMLLSPISTLEVNVQGSHEDVVIERSFETMVSMEEMASHTCDECFLSSPAFKVIHIHGLNIQEEKAKVEEEARLEVERIAEEARINAEVISENNRKNNVHFNSYDLTSISNITVDELDSVFIAKGKPAMTEISVALVDAEQTYGVNAFFLSGLVAEESGWTQFPAGDGDNLTGHAVFSSAHRGSSFGGSRYRNIMETAELIKINYLTPGGKYYNGISIEGVNTRYCLYEDMETTDYRWSSKISGIANDLSSIYHNSVKTIKGLPY